MKYLKSILTFVLFFSLTVAFSQKKQKFAENLVYTTALSYHNLTTDDFPGLERYQWSWNNNFAVNLTSSLYFGIGFFHIRTRDVVYSNPFQKENYNMAIAFLQYDIYPIMAKHINLPKKEFKFYPEIHWGYGDYCFCSWNNPSEIERSHYLGYGFGMEIPVKNRLSFLFGMLVYTPLNEALDTSNRDYYTYKIGVGFDIKK